MKKRSRDRFTFRHRATRERRQAAKTMPMRSRVKSLGSSHGESVPSLRECHNQSERVLDHRHSAEIRRNAYTMRINAIIAAHRWFEASRRILEIRTSDSYTRYLGSDARMKTGASLPMIVVNSSSIVNKKHSIIPRCFVSLIQAIRETYRITRTSLMTRMQSTPGEESVMYLEYSRACSRAKSLTLRIAERALHRRAHIRIGRNMGSMLKKIGESPGKHSYRSYRIDASRNSRITQRASSSSRAVIDQANHVSMFQKICKPPKEHQYRTYIYIAACPRSQSPSSSTRGVLGRGCPRPVAFLYQSQWFISFLLSYRCPFKKLTKETLLLHSH